MTNVNRSGWPQFPSSPVLFPLARHFVLFEPLRFGEFANGGCGTPEALVGLTEEEPPCGVSRLGGRGDFEMRCCGVGAALLEQNSAEKTSRLGEIGVERDRLLSVAASVRQSILLFVDPRQINVCGKISIEPLECSQKCPSRTIAIAECEAADSNVYGQSRQLVVLSGSSRECLQRFLMAIIMLQNETLELMPQRLTSGCLRQSLGDRPSAWIAATGICTAKREEHTGLIRRRFGARFQMRNRLTVAAELDEHEAEELPRLQEGWFRRVNRTKRFGRCG